ncbi:unnamed protein product [Diamesa serratosioi]
MAPATTPSYTVPIQLRLDAEYIKAYHGMIKIGILIMAVINITTVNVSAVSNGITTFYNTTVSVGFWYTLILLFLFLFHVPEKFYRLPWLPVEIVGNALVGLTYFIASIMVMVVPDSSHTTAGLFGFITLAGYALGGFLKYKQYRNGDLAQGKPSPSRVTTIPQSSAFPA